MIVLKARTISTTRTAIRDIAKRIFLALPVFLQPHLLRRLHPHYRWIAQATQHRVASGPFQGMRYTYRSVGSSLFPKLLGTYEKELSSAIELAMARQPRLVVDIGAAEGYYAIGLATRLPKARIVCFEAQENYHYLLRKLAMLNEVMERLTVLGSATAPLLNEHLNQEQAILVICDIEGAEDQLLDPATAPALRHTDILVELHDLGTPGVSGRIYERFKPTHTITKITSRQRRPEDWPLAPEIPWKKQKFYLSEHRPGPMDWFWMIPKDAEE